ncbi:MAG TPA: hypothetical protein ENK19_03825 [Acidobacteria bacterium]|nr:hypothetical protein [Acidobacteriota bacterium]
MSRRALAAALFDWVLDLPRAVVEDLPPPGPGDGGPRPRVLLHLDGGFRWVATGEVGRHPAETWRRRGLGVKRIGVVAGGRAPGTG